MEDLQNIIIEKPSYSAYIPILDRDAGFSARFLTKEDLKKAHKLLMATYTDLEEGGRTYIPLMNSILDSSNNFIWFATLFKEIEKGLGVESSFKIPYKLCPKNKGYAPTVYQPFEAIKRLRGNCVRELKTNVKDQDPINNYRIRYIMAQFDMDEFQDDCYPGWYLLKDTTVFEQYNEKTNTRVRIDFKNGDFYYFTAGASDNWQPIERVPMEMNHVISALLFRNIRN